MTMLLDWPEVDSTPAAEAAVESWTRSTAALDWVPGAKLTFDSEDWEKVLEISRAVGVEEFNKRELVLAVSQRLVEKLEESGVTPSTVPGWVAQTGLTHLVTRLIAESVLEHCEKLTREHQAP